ncbi:MAG: hypothetical protein LC737_08175, partial [Chloroflexi bacterium]|nr:hypothetical protein [Chloroflexota bacterium]
FYVLSQTLRRHRSIRPPRRAAHAAIGLFGVQILVGGLNVFTKLQPAVNTLHLAVATAVWGGMVAFALIAWYTLGAQPARVRSVESGALHVEQSYSASSN